METLGEILEDLDEIVKNTRFNLPDLSADLWAIERRLREKTGCDIGYSPPHFLCPKPRTAGILVETSQKMGKLQANRDRREQEYLL